MYDYAMWGNGYDDSFWGYGYDDIYTGLFAPYGYDDLTGYLPQTGTSPGASGTASPATAAPGAPTDQLAQMCGQDSRDIAGLPIDQFQQTIQRATRRARRSRQRLAQGGARHEGSLPDRHRADGAEPARRDATAYRGDDRRGSDSATAAGNLLWPSE
jgi:hypothetical protein